jgi:hypothetical protein
MNTPDKKTNTLLDYSYRCLNFYEMLIQQSDTWLSAEEGNENMIKEIKRQKAESRRQKYLNIKH